MSDEIGGGEAAITLTFKAGAGYDAPWVVIRADDPEQAINNLEALGQTGLLAKVAETATELHAVYNVAAGLGGKAEKVEGTQQKAAWSGRSGSRQQTQDAPTEDKAPTPQCQHGQRVYRTGTKNGKKWEAWFCPLPRNQGACAPEWV